MKTCSNQPTMQCTSSLPLAHLSPPPACPSAEKLIRTGPRKVEGSPGSKRQMSSKGRPVPMANPLCKKSWEDIVNWNSYVSTLESSFTRLSFSACFASLGRKYCILQSGPLSDYDGSGFGMARSCAGPGVVKDTRYISRIFLVQAWIGSV